MNYILDTKTVIAADLDGTIADSKSAITPEMAETISKWLSTNRFAIISGGRYEQFQIQVISQLPPATNLSNLFIFPYIGATCLTFKDGVWVQAYEETLTDNERTAIGEAIKKAVELSGVTFPEIKGDQIEYLSGEVTFSALGLKAELKDKLVWDADHEKRKLIISHLSPLLPDYTISVAGTTSINITAKGVDKASAIEKMKKLLGVTNENVIFFGDALFEGGNDFPATKTGVTCIEVRRPLETKEKIDELIASLLV